MRDKIKQNQNATFHILLLCLFLMPAMTLFMVVFMVNSNQNYCKHLIGSVYEAAPEVSAVLINAMLDNSYSKENIDGAMEAAQYSGYTTGVFTYIRQKYVYRLLPFIIAYIVVMLWLVSMFMHYFLFSKRAIEQKYSKIQRDYEALELEAETSAYNHEMREAQLRQFIENIAHQIKTPLAVLITDIEVCSGKKRQLVQTEKIRKLLDMLLKIARLEAGKVNFERNDEDMLNLLCNISLRLYEHYRNAAPDNNYNIFIEGSDNLDGVLFQYKLENGKWHDRKNNAYVTPDNIEVFSDKYRVWCDYDWMFEALLNVIENSFKHSDNNLTKDINIALSDNGGDVMISISDSGEGIPKEYIDHIFDRFFTGGEASYESTGIGLNLSKLIIDQLGGDIRIKQIDGRQFFVVTMPKYNILKRNDKQISLGKDKLL